MVILHGAAQIKSKLNVILRRQKHASRIIYFKDKYTHARPLLKEMNEFIHSFIIYF